MKILTGYVRTPEGQATLRRAADEALLREAELVVVHAIRAGDSREAEETAEYREELRKVEQDLQSRGVRATVRELVRLGSSADALVDYADENGADLIVIGHRSRSPVGKLVLGSNAQDILLRAPCPVLAVKASDGAGS